MVRISLYDSVHREVKANYNNAARLRLTIIVYNLHVQTRSPHYPATIREEL